MKTVGQILKESRKEKQTSLGQIAQETKIRKRFLIALEKDDYKPFSSVATIKGFIKNYAQFLGLDSEKILAIFKRDYRRNQEQKLILQPGVDLEKQFKWNPKKSLILIIALFIIAFSSYLIHQYYGLLGKPGLEIYSPEDNKQVTEEQLIIKGKTDLDNSVSVNGNLIQINNQGEFNYRLKLISGENKIVIEVTNRLGRKTREMRHVYLN
jgi:DNA-binding XRE family transcriptional regulator